VTKASDNPFPSVLIRESADDGSDFTNPDADYRRLFLGEDGQLHVKDSAGTVTGIGGAIADILDIATAETDDTLVLAPDGVGGVEFRAEAGGLATGTTFPVSPATGDRYRRSDLAYLIYFWDGTRWVSEQVFTLTSTFQGASVADDTVWHLAIPADAPIYLTTWDIMVRGGVTAATWDVELYAEDFAGTETLLDEVSSTSGSGSWYSYTRALDDVVDGSAGNSGTNITHLQVTLNENTGTETARCTVAVHYRRIAT
jgi:hypothetical protein